MGKRCRQGAWEGSEYEFLVVRTLDEEIDFLCTNVSWVALYAEDVVEAYRRRSRRRVDEERRVELTLAGDTRRRTTTSATNMKCTEMLLTSVNVQEAFSKPPPFADDENSEGETPLRFLKANPPRGSIVDRPIILAIPPRGRKDDQETQTRCLRCHGRTMVDDEFVNDLNAANALYTTLKMKMTRALLIN